MTYPLYLAHINDTHSHFDASLLHFHIQLDGEHYQIDAHCGGYARLASAIKQQRKQAQRIFYSITNNTENNTLTNAKNDQTKAQNLRPTKEISLPKYNAKDKIPDNVRIEQIKQEQQRKQMQRDNWL